MMQRIALGLVCVIIAAYTVFHIVSLFSPDVTTIVVASTTERTTVAFDGYIFRDETVLYSSYGGTVDYAVEDGRRVLAGTALATVYATGDNDSMQSRLQELDAQIAVLERAVADKPVLADLIEVRQALDAGQEDVAKMLAEGNAKTLSEHTDAFLSELCRSDLLTNRDSSVKQTLARLQEERAALLARDGDSETVYTQESGYFFAGCDGYEEYFSMNALEGITAERFADLTSAEPKQDENMGKYAVGRMMYTSRWCFAASIPTEDLRYFEVGVQYHTAFTGNGSLMLPLTLERIERTESGAILIFECDRLPNNFDFSRYQSVEIEVESVTGIHVPKTATHRRDGAYYVYILRGGVVLERKIEISYEGSDYYLVRDNVSYEGVEDLYLKSNDQLILSGNNLFDGRILE